jgi:hypothetical protein
MIYILIVWSAAAQVGDQPLFVDPRPMNFAECRMMRNSNIVFYEALRDTPVYVLCQQEISDE